MLLGFGFGLMSKSCNLKISYPLSRQTLLILSLFKKLFGTCSTKSVFNWGLFSIYFSKKSLQTIKAILEVFRFESGSFVLSKWHFNRKKIQSQKKVPKHTLIERRKKIVFKVPSTCTDENEEIDDKVLESEIVEVMLWHCARGMVARSRKKMRMSLSLSTSKLRALTLASMPIHFSFALSLFYAYTIVIEIKCANSELSEKKSGKKSFGWR